MNLSFEDIIAKLPRPYYQDNAVCIIHADCRLVLPLIPEKSIDLVLTDPPYGINFTAANFEKHNAKRGSARVRVTEIMTNDDGSLNLSWLENYTRRIVWGFPYLNSPQATGWFVWAKRQDNAPNPMGNPVEMAYSTVWSGFHYKFFLWCGYLREDGEPRFDHPTQKPNAIISYLLNKASEPNNVILDPFLGSGTTAFCAKKLGRKCIGIEIEEKYCEISAKRCAQMVLSLESEQVKQVAREPLMFQGMSE